MELIEYQGEDEDIAASQSVEESYAEHAEFVKSRSGKPKLVRGGYAYVKVVVKRGVILSKQYWRCVKTSSTCRARIHTINDQIVSILGSHNHLPDPALKGVLTVVSEIKQIALTSHLPAHKIVSNTIEGLDPGIASHLPAISSLQKSVSRVRQKHKIHIERMLNPHPLTGNPSDIPDMYKVTTTGEDFLLFDSAPGAADTSSRIFIFSTHQNLGYLGTSSRWILDESFSSLPENIFRLLTILAIPGPRAVPLAFILIPNDEEDTYRKVFDAMLLIQPELSPDFISVEFNKNYIAVLKERFPSAAITARLYNLCQLIFKRVQLEGLEERYLNDLEFSIQMRNLAALAFIPLPLVQEIFDMVVDHFPREGINVLGYFEDTFIGRFRRKNLQDEATYPPKLWNLYDSAGQDSFISNEMIFEWQQTLSSISVANQKVTFWRFLKGLQECQVSTRNTVEQLMAGAVLKSNRKRNPENLKFLAQTVKKYDSLEPLVYLKLIASNIGC